MLHVDMDYFKYTVTGRKIQHSIVKQNSCDKKIVANFSHFTNIIS